MTLLLLRQLSGTAVTACREASVAPPEAGSGVVGSDMSAR